MVLDPNMGIDPNLDPSLDPSMDPSLDPGLQPNESGQEFEADEEQQDEEDEMGGEIGDQEEGNASMAATNSNPHSSRYAESLDNSTCLQLCLHMSTFCSVSDTTKLRASNWYMTDLLSSLAASKSFLWFPLCAHPQLGCHPALYVQASSHIINDASHVCAGLK